MKVFSLGLAILLIGFIFFVPVSFTKVKHVEEIGMNKTSTQENYKVTRTSTNDSNNIEDNIFNRVSSIFQ